MAQRKKTTALAGFTDPGPDYEMYDEVLLRFMHYMRRELADNYKKGDRQGNEHSEHGWADQKSNKVWTNELYYHVGKLQSALMNGQIDRVEENCADIANLAMMCLDANIDLMKQDKKIALSCTPAETNMARIFGECLMAYGASCRITISSGDTRFMSCFITVLDKQFEAFGKDAITEAMKEASKWMIGTAPDRVAAVPEAEQFVAYCDVSRRQFSRAVSETGWDNKARTAVDDFLICFDQLLERLKQTQKEE